MIVFAAYSLSQYAVLEAVAKALRKRGDDVLIVGFNDSPGIAGIAKRADMAGLRFVDLSAQVGDVSPKGIQATELPSEAAWIASERELAHRAMLLRQRGAAGKLLEQVGARLLMVCEDGFGGCGPLIAEARARRLPVLELPFGIGESRDFDNFLGVAARQGTLHLVPNTEVGANLRRHGGHWIRTVDAGDATLIPAELILARIATGLDIEQPWVVHGGAADALLVESPAMERIYLREGVPAAKLVMTGSPYADAVARVISDHGSAATDEGGASEERFKVLLAPPPSSHDIRASVAEFESYRETVEKLVTAARCHGRAEVTVSLHPNSSPQDLATWRDQDVVFSDQWILELIPQHDMLLTSFSSTSRWAIACGKPVINYDMYRLNLSTYEGMAGVVELREMDGVARLLSAMAGDGTTYARLAGKQRARASEWGILDGRAVDRILKEVDRWLAGTPAKAQSSGAVYSRASVYAESAQPAQPKHMFVWLCDHIERLHGQPSSLLDVGAAAGDFLAYARDRFPRAELLGVEFDPALVALGKKRGRSIVQGDANDLGDVASGQFEAVLMTGTHSIFEDFRTSVAECIRATKAGGTVLVTGLFNPYPLDARIHWRYPAQWDAPWHPGYNMASMDSVKALLAGQPRVTGAEFLPFELPFDLAPQSDPVRSWTEPAGQGHRSLRNGIMPLPVHCLKIAVGSSN